MTVDNVESRNRISDSGGKDTDPMCGFEYAVNTRNDRFYSPLGSSGQLDSIYRYIIHYYPSLDSKNIFN